MCTPTHTHPHPHTRTYTLTHTHSHTHTYTNIHTHTHTHREREWSIFIRTHTRTHNILCVCVWFHAHFALLNSQEVRICAERERERERERKREREIGPYARTQIHKHTSFDVCVPDLLHTTFNFQCQCSRLRADKAAMKWKVFINKGRQCCYSTRGQVICARQTSGRRSGVQAGQKRFTNIQIILLLKSRTNKCFIFEELLQERPGAVTWVEQVWMYLACAYPRKHKSPCIMLFRTRLIQATWFAGTIFRPFCIIPPPGLASSFPLDRNFSKEASSSNSFSRSFPLKKTCQHIFCQITTPPRSSLLRSN